MPSFDMLRELHLKNTTKMVLLILDGLGGMPIEAGGSTELEVASTPNMDRLAEEGTLGQIIPIDYGITPGSGPAHLALFGYDPLIYDAGRGVLEATGIGMTVEAGAVSARGNFCSLDARGLIHDRRAGRISTEEALPILELLKKVQIPEVQVEVQHVREYRFAILMRGEGLHAAIRDTDPQMTGKAPLPAIAEQPEAEKTAGYFNQWIKAAQEALKDQPKANGITLRGFSSDPALPSFDEVYGLKAACVAVYPMYRGVSKLVGMQIIDFSGESPGEEFEAVKQHWDAFDFFFVHIKKTDSRGEDGDFKKKAEVIESVDAALPELLKLGPDVVVITGDHSTPARLRSHSWHPVPLLLWAPATVLSDSQSRFGERACQVGGLGTFPSKELLPLMMAHAERLQKFGA
ncbi:MAG: 2,3-bisphosphoglycerate-independent phosphoglycerate mutase [Anaerolineales bacterium]|nr:MAG: 2,3-bisphosphoglycerate-independent phosphoglycerate mutase [Anaerolineales bacterium]